ncbi:MAG: TIGR03435 family protein [Acidobacteriota bacterium]
MKRLFLPILACAAAFGQTFEVASIKPSPEINVAKLVAGGGGISALSGLNIGLKVEGTHVSIAQVSLSSMILMAYEVKQFQLVAPDWAGTQRWDISAVMPEGGTKEQVPAMLRALLAERFHLKVHREGKEESVYALVEAKGGHKMKPAPAEIPAAPVDPDAPKPALAKGEQALTIGDQQMRIAQTSGANSGVISMTGGATGATRVTVPTDAASGGKLHLEMERVTMKALTEQLSQMVDLPVVDKTGLAGAYQIALDVSIQDVIGRALAQAGRSGQLSAGLAGGAAAGAFGGGGAGASEPAGASVFSSVQALGLKLDKQKSEIDRVVVDSADKVPTEN